MESILETIKKMLGFDLSYAAFNIDILVQINMAFGTLFQMGVIDEDDYIEIVEGTNWDDFDFSAPDLALIKQYVYLKVKMVFDPPTVGSVHQSYLDQIKELEWRLYSSNNFEEEEEDA